MQVITLFGGLTWSLRMASVHHIAVAIAYLKIKCKTFENFLCNHFIDLIFKMDVSSAKDLDFIVEQTFRNFIFQKIMGFFKIENSSYNHGI